MRRLLSIVVVCAFAAAASGHGGEYHGPAGEVPPDDSREPTDPPPPPPDGLGGWTIWWRHNERGLFDLRRAQRLARGGPDEVDADWLRGRIAPALRRFAADAATGHLVRSASTIALAKLGDESIVPELRRMALNADKTLPRDVQESAALAFGILGRDDPQTRAFLVDVVRDQSLDGTFVRAFAAVSLGLLGDDGRRTTAGALLDVVRRGEPSNDVKPACLLAVGLLADGYAVRELGAAAVRLDASEIERSCSVAALGSTVGGPTTSAREQNDALDAMIAAVGQRGDPTQYDVWRSAAIALGRTAPSCGPQARRRAVAALRAFVQDDAVDEDECGFPIMALGEIAADDAADANTRAEIVDFLSGTMRESHGPAAPFAALALGIVGRAVEDSGGAAPEDEICAPLRAMFDGERDALRRGAFALASGLVRDPLAVEPLIAALRDRTQDMRLRRWCAFALGLIGDARPAALLRATLRDEADRELLGRCATALALFGDPAVVDDLVDKLHDRDASFYELGSAALALGRVGDERAADALLDVAVDADKFPDLTRALAIVALGEIGDRDDVPALARIATDVNYRAHVPAITELLTIL